MILRDFEDYTGGDCWANLLAQARSDALDELAKAIAWRRAQALADRAGKAVAERKAELADLEAALPDLERERDETWAHSQKLTERYNAKQAGTFDMGALLTSDLPKRCAEAGRASVRAGEAYRDAERRIVALKRELATLDPAYRNLARIRKPETPLLAEVYDG